MKKTYVVVLSEGRQPLEYTYEDFRILADTKRVKNTEYPLLFTNDTNLISVEEIDVMDDLPMYKSLEEIDAMIEDAAYMSWIDMNDYEVDNYLASIEATQDIE